MSRSQELNTVSPVLSGDRRIRHNSLPGLPGIEETQTPPNSQESSSGQSSSGTEEGDSQRSIDILPQGCITRELLEDSSRVLRRLYTELSSVNSAAAYHYDQYRYAVVKRNTLKRQISQTKKGREIAGLEEGDRRGKKQQRSS